MKTKKVKKGRLTLSDIYEAVDRVTPVLQKIEKANSSFR